MTFTAKRSIGLGLGAILLLVALHSCRGGGSVDLPDGPQTMTGVLQPVGISMERRGTHMLSQEGEELYFVESSRRNLRDFEGMEVVITGVLEENIDPDALPVLVASGVTLVHMQTRSWAYSDLGITFETPSGWSGSLLEDRMAFVASEETPNIALTVSSASGQKLPAGSALWVDSRPAVRVDSDESTSLFVQNGRTTIAFTFAASDGSEMAPTPEQVQWVVRSIRFTGMTRSSSSRPAQSRRSSAGSTGSATSAATGAPCGGPAGILCPSGQYCEVTDRATDIGRCRSLAR